MASTVVSFFSPSPSASRRAQDLLARLCKLEKVTLGPFKHEEDKLNSIFQSFLPMFSNSWDSVALKCQSSGTMIHFLSSSDAEDESRHQRNAFALLGITKATENDSNQAVVQSFRDLLAHSIENRSSAIKLKKSIGSFHAQEMLRDVSNGSLPLLTIGEQPAASAGDVTRDVPPSGLKEVVVPFFDYAEYTDGTTILSRLSRMHRPAVGVYQLGDRSVRVRPLPTASEDRSLPPPSLVFHCDDLEEVDHQQVGAKSGKIGFSGNKKGQLMVQHEDLLGLDIRFCSNEKVISAFDEARESLLAGSLDELQSTNTLLAGGEKSKDDDRIGVSDCWVEVRANLKSPSGFMRRRGRSGSTPRPNASPINTPDS